jgi:hypothetical protein
MATRETGQPQIIRTVSLPGDNTPWGSLNRNDLYSRYTIPDTDFDEFMNWFPFAPTGNSVRQVPGNLAPIAQLILAARPATWMSPQTLNLAQYLFLLGANGHVYQVSLGGAITDISGATILGPLSDITNWQGTTILFTDPAASKIYSWNGTTFATVFTAQPANVITVFSGRLWMANNNNVTFTAGGTFNSLGGDSGSFTIVETDCQPPIVALYPFSGQLYIFGFDWCQTLGNITSVGSPAVVNFQLSTIEARIGTNTRWSIIGLGSTLYWTNAQGVWSLQGTFPQQISGPIGGFWQNVAQASSSYSAAFGYIYETPCLFWNCTTNDATANQQVFGLTLQGKWFRTVLSQEIFICSDIDQTTGNTKVFGTDVNGNIFQMYASTTASVSSTAKFKFWNFGSSAAFKRMYKVGATMFMNNATTITATLYDESGNVIPFLRGAAYTQQNFSSTVVFTDSNGNPITWTAGTNITWIAGNLNLWESFEWGIDDIAKRFGLQLVVAGIGATFETLNMELEIGIPKWGK